MALEERGAEQRWSVRFVYRDCPLAAVPYHHAVVDVEAALCSIGQDLTVELLPRKPKMRDVWRRQGQAYIETGVNHGDHFAHLAVWAAQRQPYGRLKVSVDD